MLTVAVLVLSFKWAVNKVVVAGADDVMHCDGCVYVCEYIPTIH